MSEHALFENNGKGLNNSHVFIRQAPAHACLFAMANNQNSLGNDNSLCRILALFSTPVF